MSETELMRAAKSAALTIQAIYEWIDMVDKAGGTGSIPGAAKAHAMIESLKKNSDRTERLVMEPLRKAILDAEKLK